MELTYTLLTLLAYEVSRHLELKDRGNLAMSCKDALSLMKPQLDLVPLSEIKWEYMKAMIDQVEAHGAGKLRYFYESKTTKVKGFPLSWLMGNITKEDNREKYRDPNYRNYCKNTLCTIPDLKITFCNAYKFKKLTAIKWIW